VVNYVEKLLNSKFSGQKLQPSEIGIVSPYRGQITKIHRALERKKITGVGIGSVEEFQGLERRVIIISTVRSNPLELQIDRKFRIGFVREPKVQNIFVESWQIDL
jgi:helicase MOV-10